jgi:hypothetical protein
MPEYVPRGSTNERPNAVFAVVLSGQQVEAKCDVLPKNNLPDTLVKSARVQR